MKIWPVGTAPYTVCITPLSVKPDSDVMKLAEQYYAELTAKGVDVIEVSAAGRMNSRISEVIPLR